MGCKPGHPWLTPVILAIQEADIRRIIFESQLQTVHEPLSQKTHDKRLVK
jgi:hypothetical protein